MNIFLGVDTYHPVGMLADDARPGTSHILHSNNKEPAMPLVQTVTPANAFGKAAYIYCDIAWNPVINGQSLE